MTINDMAREEWHWVESVGWHNKSTLESLALIASEVGEAVNECRMGRPSPKFGEELADIILRTIDLAKTCDINIQYECLTKMKKNRARGTRGRKI